MTRWLDGPDEADLGVLREAAGPVLDVGCGPGRMLDAAAQAGLVAVGIDTEKAATDLTRQKGFNAITGSIFDPLPGEILFGTILLLDGNVGIGADPAALLARCRDLLAAGGTVIVETHPEADRNDVFVAHLASADGGDRSDTFPWAEIGAVPLTGYAARAGLYPVQHRMGNHRTFVHLQHRR
ncbi:class I SAM-dependent methyltransferase [Frondihabitans peucedani]|uniref:Methyltransferase family protein n=1 Tax=Frondihabitans peucedani TaxID=598626 RepID=A0ABP8E3Q7_9MICO